MCSFFSCNHRKKNAAASLFIIFLLGFWSLFLIGVIPIRIFFSENSQKILFFPRHLQKGQLRKRKTGTVHNGKNEQGQHAC